MKLLKLEDWQFDYLCDLFKQHGKYLNMIDPRSYLATNKDILTSVTQTCEQYNHYCETCPYWLKNKFTCIWFAHKFIGKDVMAYWDDEIEERKV